MIIGCISLSIGIMAAIIAHTFMRFSQKLSFDKNLRSRFNNVNKFRLRGITGNMLFLADKIGGYINMWHIPFVPPLAERIRKAILIAGKPWDTVQPYTFIGIQLESALVLPIVSIIVLDIYNLFGLLVAATVGFYLPILLLQEKVKENQKAIFRQLPDVLDLLSLMMEAGLDFNAALNKITCLEKGALIIELDKVQQEVKLGKSRSDAFKDMGERLNYAPLTSVTNAFTIAFKTGASLTPTLKSLSEQFRIERMQLAEKIANEAPVKLLIPIVLFIFPTVFVILFGPIALSFLNGGF